MHDNAKLSKIIDVRMLRLLLCGCLLASSLFAQTSDTRKDKKDKSAEENQPVAAGVSVDSARKSSDLPVAWDTTQTNRGETAGGFEVKQSAEFGGRITDFTGSRAV